MRDQRLHWSYESRMRTHNAWHLAMFDIKNGNVASALSILDTCLLPACETSSIDACDAVGLLWYLGTEGINDDSRWNKISNAFARSSTAGFWPFLDLHAALAHLAAGQFEREQYLERSVIDRGQRNDFAALRARLITAPGVRALRAWFEGRYRDAANLAAQVNVLLLGAGGSGIQLELFRSLLSEALRRSQMDESSGWSQNSAISNVRSSEYEHLDSLDALHLSVSHHPATSRVLLSKEM